MNFVSIALKHINEDKSIAEKTLRELSSITNLIIEDGFNEYRFIHKSIQEFFAASFIISLQHDKKIAFYKKCFNDYSFYTTFHNTLFFLEELDYYNFHEHGFIPAITNFLSLSSQYIKNDNYVIPPSVKEIFLNDIYIRVKFTSFKAGHKESYEIEKTNFTFDKSDFYPSLFSNVFLFSLDFMKVELTDKELISLIRENANGLEGGWCKLSIRKILDFKRLPETIALEALRLSIDVLIRRRYNKAVDKINNRKDSLNSTDYFNF